MKIFIKEFEEKQITIAPLNRNFWKWFDKSIVKTNNDEPLIVHHGTPKGGFNSFIPSTNKKRSNYQLDFGTHFTTDKEHAKIYLSREKRESSKPAKASHIYDCYLRIINPFDANQYYYREDNPEEFKRQLAFAKDIFGKQFKKIFSSGNFFNDKKMIKHKEIQFLMFGNYLDYIPPNKLYQKLKEYGYDGVIYNPLIFDLYTVEKQKLAYIVLDTNQIKSIYNDGSFDLNDNNIYS